MFLISNPISSLLLYMKTFDLLLTLYYLTLLLLLISARSFLVVFLHSLEVSTERNILSLNKASFISSFSICRPFISSSPLIALARILSTMLENSGEKRHPRLVSDLNRKVKYDVCFWDFIRILYYTEEASLHFLFTETFHHD